MLRCMRIVSKKIHFQHEIVLFGQQAQWDFYKCIGQQPLTKQQIFTCFSNFCVFKLATKHMAKWSGDLVTDQSSGGLWVENRAEITSFSFKFFKIVQFFSHFCSCAFLSISANLELIPWLQSTSSPILKFGV